MPTKCEPSCTIINLPEVIPMAYTQTTFINLERYFTGTNITFKVQPNNIYSNMKEQYFCRQPQSYMLGNIKQAKRYQIDNKVYLALLGQSSSNAHIYMVYYNILIQIVSSDETKTYANQDIFNEDIKADNIHLTAMEVIEVPRFKIDNCTSMALNMKKDSLQFVVDCRPVQNDQRKVLAYVNVPITTQQQTSKPLQWNNQQKQQQQKKADPTWQLIQSDIYIDQTQQYPQSQIQLLTNKNHKFITRIVKSQIDSYVQLWKWNDDNLQKQIINLYDNNFFNQDEANSNMDLLHWQIFGSYIAILDYYNGIHILRINAVGSMSYLSLMKMQYYTTFYFDQHEEILFAGKKGRIEQYRLVISQIRTLEIISIREQLFHLVVFQNIRQIISMNRFLYAITNTYTHVFHLESMLTADSANQAKGSYMTYPQYYGFQLFPTATGFIKLSNYSPDISIQACDINPPFLYLRAPFNSPLYDSEKQRLRAFNFVINGFSTFQGQTTFCYQVLQSQLTLPNEDFIFSNGFNVQNETIFANKPGTSLISLNKYGFGKNINYQVKLINNQINFTSNIRKVNQQTCVLGSNRNQPILSSQTIGNWLIIQYVHSSLKEYFICQNYNGTQCQLIFYHQEPIAEQLKSYNLISNAGNGVIIYANTYIDRPHVIYVKSVQENSFDQDDLAAINNICQVTFDDVIMYQIQKITLQNGRLYVLFKNLKEIHLFALQGNGNDNECAFVGKINAESLRWVYFSPQYFTFDGQGLIQQVVLPNAKNTKTQKGIQISYSTSQVIYITQFNEIIIIKIFFSNGKIDITRVIQSFVFSQLTPKCELIVMAPYLLMIDKVAKKVNQYFLTQEYYPYYMRSLVDELILTGPIRILSRKLVAIGVTEKQTSSYMFSIYELDALVSAGKQYAYWNVSRASINTIKFSDTEFAFILPVHSQTLNSVICQSTILSQIPYLQLQFPTVRSFNEPTKQQFYLQLQTKSDFKRHIVNLQLSNFINILQKGSRFPYKGYAINFQENMHEKQFQVLDTYWFKGNIFAYEIRCPDCSNGRVKAINKINRLEHIKLDSQNQPTQFYVDRFNSISFYKFDIISSFVMTAIEPQRDMSWLNKIYSQYVSNYTQNFGLNLKQQQDESTYRFAQSTILSSQQGKCLRETHDDHSFFFVSLCQIHQPFQSSAKLQIKIHSQTSFKSAIINQYTIQIQQLFSKGKNEQNLKLTSRQNKQLILQDDLIVIRYYDNIYLLTILSGQIILLDNFNNQDFGGGHICNTEIADKKDQGELLNKNYTLIISLCQDGFAYMVFNIIQKTVNTEAIQNGITLGANKDNFRAIKIPVIRLIVSQQINLNAQLQKSKIKIPQSSLYLSTVTQQIEQKEMLIHTLVENFNSFIWRIQLGVSVSIVKISLQAIIYRYGLFSAYQITLGQHLTILYRATTQVQKIGEVVEYIAVYDPNNVPLSDIGIKQYYMFSAETTQIVGTQTGLSPSRIRQIDNKLYVLNYNNLYVYETVNKIRIFVTNYYDLQSQFLHRQQTAALKNKNTHSKSLQSLRASTYNNSSSNLKERNYDELYTQTIVILVYTPVNARSVSLKLYAIDKFQLSGLQLFVIIVAGIVVIAFLILIFRFGFKRYKEKKKLVPLLEDYEQKQDSDQQNAQQTRNNNNKDVSSQQEEDAQQIKHQKKQFNINESVRESVDP